MHLTKKRANKISSYAFTLMEMLVSVAIIGILFVSFYVGIASGFGVVNLARENLRANQIALEKMETIRLYTWEQINSNGFIPPTFTAPFHPPVAGETNNTNSSFVYYGNVTIENAPVASAYSNNMRLVTVTVLWTNSGTARTRSMQTLVSEHGMQNYIY
ncbi:MAG: type II secretion system protein [Verrucomicrobiota bacterium]|nr:type II secretion system protein [Verrucomicrobiota bacterium]